MTTSHIQSITKSTKSANPPHAEFMIQGMELQHLQAIGKLMQSHSPENFADDTLHLTTDDINRLGELVNFLAVSRMDYDELAGEQQRDLIQAAAAKSQSDTLDYVKASFRLKKRKTS